MVWMILWYVITFFFGACSFSFLNVVIYRVPKGISFVKGRSFCPICNHTLGGLDLIPVISYMGLRGRCRYCNTKFGFRDTLVEIFGGMASVFLLWFYEWDFVKTILVFLFYCVLTVVALIDADTMEIPDGCHLVIAALAVAAVFVFPGIGIVERLIGALCVSVPMLLLALAIADAFGGGDIKLMAAGGLFLGWKLTLLSAALAVLIGGIYGIFLLVTKKANKKDQFAFGPFLCAGMAIGLLYGQQIIDWYLSFLIF